MEAIHFERKLGVRLHLLSLWFEKASEYGDAIFYNVLGALGWDGGAERACGCVFVFAEWAGVAVAGEFF